MVKISRSDLRPWQVERRKYQNAAAQRRRRQKLKEGLTFQRCHSPQPAAKEASSLSKRLISAIYSCFMSDTERSSTAIIMAVENFSLYEVVKYGLISLGYTVYPDSLIFAEEFAFHSWTSWVMPTISANIELESVIRAGINTLVSLKGPQTWSGHISPMALAKALDSAINSVQSIGNPAITIRTGFCAASLANCHLLGIDPCAVMNHGAESPFVRPVHHALNKKHEYFSDATETQEQTSQNSMGDMYPTLEQLVIPHHPYLDIIPWPSFRSRAIIASSMDPPLIDKNELCLDLLSDGLYCHSIRGVSLHGRGEGMPWDSRSWEAKPWFMKKWSFLVMGTDVQQTSSWWYSQA